MANQMTMKRRVIWGCVQMQPSARQRIWVCESVVLLVIWINAVLSAGETFLMVEVGWMVGRKPL
jgi:hypothetical protein